jgi:hypothetical protein
VRASVRGSDLDYQELRARCRNRVQEVVSRHQGEVVLRGSWKYGDFHLAIDGRSLSDLDAVAEGASHDECARLCRALTSEISSDLRLQVSVHERDYLMDMNLPDSRVLNVCEYLAKLRLYSQQRGVMDYVTAKILLLLVRRSPRERYREVGERVGTEAVEQAVRVKLGESRVFPASVASSLAVSSGEASALEFIEECVMRRPSSRFIGKMVRRLQACPTIASPLQAYVAKKMGLESA